MKPLELSEAERLILRDMKQSESGTVLSKILEHEVEAASYAYNNATEDHRYYQGRLHGLYQFKRTVDEASRERPAPLPVNEADAAIWKTKPSSSMDF